MSVPDKKNTAYTSGKHVSPVKKAVVLESSEPFRSFRVEGIGRKGVRYVKIIGRPGEWYIWGLDGEKKEVIRPDAKTLQDVLRIGRRFIGFQPICIREIPTDHK